MKRDDDLIRDTLLKMEDADDYLFVRAPSFGCSEPSEWFALDRSQSGQIATPLGQRCQVFGH
jgi:hypothetical protein